jgi:hypothetical protein
VSGEIVSEDSYEESTATSGTLEFDESYTREDPFQRITNTHFATMTYEFLTPSQGPLLTAEVDIRAGAIATTAEIDGQGDASDADSYASGSIVCTGELVIPVTSTFRATATGQGQFRRTTTDSSSLRRSRACQQDKIFVTEPGTNRIVDLVGAGPVSIENCGALGTPLLQAGGLELAMPETSGEASGFRIPPGRYIVTYVMNSAAAAFDEYFDGPSTPTRSASASLEYRGRFEVFLNPSPP